VKEGDKMLTRKFMLTIMLCVPWLVAGSVQADGDPTAGQELSIDCADCHGADGKGDEDNPPIAGLDATKHFEMLKAYQSGELVDDDEVMLMFTEELSEQDMADLAAYYATLAN
jgi:sulfide dehydrogenase cytochrome subunit